MHRSRGLGRGTRWVRSTGIIIAVTGAYYDENPLKNLLWQDLFGQSDYG